MQLHLQPKPRAEDRQNPDLSAPRAIESDDFPFEHLSHIAERESWRKEIYRPIYHVHKWWARRLGSVFRGILLGALTPEGTDVLESFYSPERFPDKVVFDPFMGSGTTLGETLKLGGRAIGRDINPVSYLQVRTALTLNESNELEKTYKEIEKDVAHSICSYYTGRRPDGGQCQVLYYFWVMQTVCPTCSSLVDLFSSYIFARHAYARRNPTVQVVCPNCGSLNARHYQVRRTECSSCGHSFDAATGPARGGSAECPNCLHRFAIGRTISRTGGPPSYRMYAKLVLTSDGTKEYLPIDDYDHALYAKAAADLGGSGDLVPQGSIEPGHNTNQALNYGFQSWRQMFNARQLLAISILAGRIKEIENPPLRYAFACLFSGVLEFNNMFASYKGEGTGAVRHMFYHHILKPERTPLEANIWGTPKSSGAFSTLFRNRLMRAHQYARRPFELSLAPDGERMRSVKVDGINEPLIGIANTESYEQFRQNARLYVSCGDSAATDLPDESVDLVVTDPPFFDNVHYSQLADFFFEWQRLILDDAPSHRMITTRSASEVQNSDAEVFTERLTLVFREMNRVLKDDGLLIFTYHHSKWEGWRSVLNAVSSSGFRIGACHPVKAEMSIAAPKHQAKEPIVFDIIMVCRKSPEEPFKSDGDGSMNASLALGRAEAQVKRLRDAGWKLSRNDIGVVVMSQVVAEITRRPGTHRVDRVFEKSKDLATRTIDRLHSRSPEAHRPAPNISPANDLSGLRDSDRFSHRFSRGRRP